MFLDVCGVTLYSKQFTRGNNILDHVIYNGNAGVTLLNVNGLTSKFENLRKIFDYTKPNLGIITETKRNPDSGIPEKEKLKGYVQYHNEKSAN